MSDGISTDIQVQLELRKKNTLHFFTIITITKHEFLIPVEVLGNCLKGVNEIFA